MVPVRRKVPAHERVHTELRRMILYGELRPGQPVTLHGIAEGLGAGLTPVRESLRRLTAEGALAFGENRRIMVPHLTCDQVDQLALTRLTVEPAMAARAAMCRAAVRGQRTPRRGRSGSSSRSWINPSASWRSRRPDACRSMRRAPDRPRSAGSCATFPRCWHR
ncbi:hypothetical protein C2I36_05190 [Rhodobacteraceae bacterium WD3A24]|nr:hypothetical protein C2I36_05190 [Rhodobacteraceae bacterium WD3A24]